MSAFTPWPDDFARRYRELGYWQGQTLGGLLRERAASRGEHCAIVCGERRWSYAELDTRAAALATGLARLGIRAGDRVVVQLPNVAEFYAVNFALFRLGAWPVFALPAHRRSELSHFCAYAQARAYITTDIDAGFDHRQLAREVRGAVPELEHVIIVGDAQEFIALDSLYDAPVALPEPAASDVALLQLSGGSTGLSKLIPRTHDDYLYSVRASADLCGLTAASVYLCALPAAHNFPLSSPGALGVFHAGGTVVLTRRPNPEDTFALIARERVTITALVPPLALVWLDAQRQQRADLSSLAVLQVGGAKLSEAVARRIGPELGCTLQQVFGMAEGLVNYTRLDDGFELVVGSQGRPISPHDEVLIVDDNDAPLPPGATGHLLTRGPYTIRGYYRAPEHNARAFTTDGYYRTGDIARQLPGGHLVVEGRAKDQINRGGEKVAAEEVENHLLAHPQVADVALVAMPDAYLG
ncbi:MAG TPA: AMP-binding protein, partial [Chitinolyticbacter sp.]|nr:AMP-binding protein [Chitinolyticbacter sp.]